ncbi:MAG: HK97 family phage prohead protease [Sphaerobacter sp.]|nr:HK97 family phage prohead protease [Sphaerobacter sp.]
MPAIPVHHTDTSDRPWDGPANEARLKLNQPASYYRQAYAWVDPEGDPETKAAYRFIHHEVDGDGNIGPANVRACITGIAVLNGGRGGTTIPDADREGVYRHLAAHLRDAGREPPELKAAPSGFEHRAFTPEALEVRALEDGTPRIVGYAAVFDVPSEDLGGFTEIIRPGAFRKTLQDGADVRALWNHDPNWVLGRTKAGTLKLAEDERGLRIEITPPPTAWARDLMESIRRGDVDQMSFGFWTVRDRWSSDETGRVTRELIEVKLFDVSPVTFPAYPQTEVQVRSAIAELEQMIRRLAGFLPPAAPPPAGHPAGMTGSLELMRRRLMLAERD